MVFKVVLVAQLVERSLPIPEIRGSIQVISNFIYDQLPNHYNEWSI